MKYLHLALRILNSKRYRGRPTDDRRSVINPIGEAILVFIRLPFH